MADRPLALVFTGHMVDKPDRKDARFPKELVEAAAREIEQRIARLTAGGPKDKVEGFASLARGGDILFHEICRARGFRTTIALPFAPQLFLKTSVEGVEGGDWPKRFERLWDETPPDRRHDLGLPQSEEAYALCNDFLLDLAQKAGEPQLIALWDRSSGEGPGGTADFVERAQRAAGLPPEIIDPKTLPSLP